MTTEISIVIFCFTVIIVLLISERYRKKRFARKQRELQDAERLAWQENRSRELQNEELIKLLNPTLPVPEDITEFIRLNRHNFPSEEEWNGLLPNMVKDLLAIGWTTHSKIYAKQKYAYYRIDIITDDETLRKNADKVFGRYLWVSELLVMNPKYIATNHSDVITETEITQGISKSTNTYIKIEPDIYEDLNFDNNRIVQCLEIIRQKLPEILGVNEVDIETFITTESNFLGQEYSLIGMNFKGNIEKLNSEDIEDKVYEWMEIYGTANKLLDESELK